MQERIKANWSKPNPFRRRMVFFEGLDKTGKTALCRRLRSSGGTTVPFHDRGFISRAVFYEFRKEEEFPIDDWLYLEEMLVRRDAYAVIWLRSKISTVVNRHFDTGEMLEFTIAELVQQEELFRQHMESLKEDNVPVLELWTDQLTIEECEEAILKWTGVI